MGTNYYWEPVCPNCNQPLPDAERLHIGPSEEKPAPVTLTEMIACVRRELALRKNVYPKWVANGRMKQRSADNEIRVMQGVHDVLVKLDTAVDTMVEAELGPRVDMPIDENAKALAGLAAFNTAAKKAGFL